MCDNEPCTKDITCAKCNEKKGCEGCLFICNTCEKYYFCKDCLDDVAYCETCGNFCRVCEKTVHCECPYDSYSDSE